MANDLTWFPFFVDDWLGGTVGMLQGELGAYLQALIAQWKSGDFQAIKDDKKYLRNVCRGPMTSQVREKFTTVTIKGQRYLRNKRLAEIYEDQVKAHQKRSDRARTAAQARHGHTPSNAPSSAPGMLPQKLDKVLVSEVGSLLKENSSSSSGAALAGFSKFSYEECLAFARTQPRVRNHEAFAVTIHRSGEQDSQIESFLQSNETDGVQDWRDLPQFKGAI